jgi:hypothetical protein
MRRYNPMRRYERPMSKRRAMERLHEERALEQQDERDEIGRLQLSNLMAERRDLLHLRDERRRPYDPEDPHRGEIEGEIWFDREWDILDRKYPLGAMLAERGDVSLGYGDWDSDSELPAGLYTTPYESHRSEYPRRKNFFGFLGVSRRGAMADFRREIEDKYGVEANYAMGGDDWQYEIWDEEAEEITPEGRARVIAAVEEYKRPVRQNARGWSGRRGAGMGGTFRGVEFCPKAIKERFYERGYALAEMVAGFESQVERRRRYRSSHPVANVVAELGRHHSPHEVGDAYCEELDFLCAADTRLAQTMQKLAAEEGLDIYAAQRTCAASQQAGFMEGARAMSQQYRHLSASALMDMYTSGKILRRFPVPYHVYMQCGLQEKPCGDLTRKR